MLSLAGLSAHMSDENSTAQETREQGQQRGKALLDEIKKRHRGTSFRRFDALRSAVHELCSAEYLATWGYDFSGRTKNRILGEVHAKLRAINNEREARKLLADIEDIARRALRFQEVAMYEGGAGTVVLLNHVLPRLDPILARMPALPNFRNLEKYNHVPPQSDARHAALISVADGAMATMLASGSSLSPRELAVLGLLLEIPWDPPDRWEKACKEGIAAAKVIEREADTMAKTKATLAKLWGEG